MFLFNRKDGIIYVYKVLNRSHYSFNYHVMHNIIIKLIYTRISREYAHIEFRLRTRTLKCTLTVYMYNNIISSFEDM